MTLQDISKSSGKKTYSSSSALVRLPTFWHYSEVPPPRAEWEMVWDVFVLRVYGKHAISVPDLFRTPTKNLRRQAAILNNLNKQAAERDFGKTYRMSHHGCLHPEFAQQNGSRASLYQTKRRTSRGVALGNCI